MGMLQLPIDEKLMNKESGIDVEERKFDFTRADRDMEGEAKRIHHFYFPRFPIYGDPKLKLKINDAEKVVNWMNKARSKIEKDIRLKEVERAEIISQLELLILQNKRYRDVLKEKWKQNDTLQGDIAKLHRSSKTRHNGSVLLCSSVEDLDDLIRSLHYRMQHDSNSLEEEKLVLKEIKQLEGTRKKVIAMAARRAKIQVQCGRNECHLQNQYLDEFMDVDLVKMRRRKHAIATKVKFMEEQCKALEKQIISFKKDLILVNKKRAEAYESLAKVRWPSDERNANHYINRLLLRDARKLAAKKDIAALDELSNVEVEKFMSRWNNDKAFREDYASRISPSLDN